MGENLFETASRTSNYRVSPTYRQHVQSAIDQSSYVAGQVLKTILSAPTAVWIDTATKIHGNDPESMQTVLEAASRLARPPLCVFVLSNLPNRACDELGEDAAEICCSYNADRGCAWLSDATHCTSGITEYGLRFIDPIATLLKHHASVPVVLVLEPAALPRLVVRAESPRCSSAATRDGYLVGLRYAVETLHAAAPSAALYLDAANGAWLGEPSAVSKFVTLFAQLGVQCSQRDSKPSLPPSHT